MMINLFKTVVLCLCLALTVSFAHARGGKGGAGGGGKCGGFGNGAGYGNSTRTTKQSNYVDKNGDGICDNSGTAIKQQERKKNQNQNRKTNSIKEGSVTQTDNEE